MILFRSMGFLPLSVSDVGSFEDMIVFELSASTDESSRVPTLLNNRPLVPLSSIVADITWNSGSTCSESIHKISSRFEIYFAYKFSENFKSNNLESRTKTRQHERDKILEYGWLPPIIFKSRMPENTFETFSV